MFAAGAVDVEEEGWVGGFVWEGGEVHALLVPLLWIRLRGVGRCEPVGEAWVVVGLLMLLVFVGCGGLV